MDHHYNNSDKSAPFHFLNVQTSDDPLTGQTPSLQENTDSDALTMFMGQCKPSHMPISQGLGHHQPIPVNHRERVPVNFATTLNHIQTSVQLNKYQPASAMDIQSTSEFPMMREVTSIGISGGLGTPTSEGSVRSNTHPDVIGKNMRPPSSESSARLSENDEYNDNEYDKVATDKMKFWRENYPAWYQVLKYFEIAVHNGYRELPFRVVTSEDCNLWIAIVLDWYNSDHLHSLMFLDDRLISEFHASALIIAQYFKPRAQTKDFNKCIARMQHVLEDSMEQKDTYRFFSGMKLTCTQIVKNKLLSCMFADLDGLCFTYFYLNGILLQPFGHFTFVGFICDLLAGSGRLDPKKCPFSLRFFLNNRIEPHVITYGILVCYHLARQHRTGNLKPYPDFTEAEYGHKFLAINKVVLSFQSDKQFIHLLGMIYDAMMKGN